MPEKTSKNDTTGRAGKKLVPAAERALAEAEERRKAAMQKPPKEQRTKKNEVGGRDGPEPTRYGDWEKNGLTSDF